MRRASGSPADLAKLLLLEKHEVRYHGEILNRYCGFLWARQGHVRSCEPFARFTGLQIVSPDGGRRIKIR